MWELDVVDSKGEALLAYSSDLVLPAMSGSVDDCGTAAAERWLLGLPSWFDDAGLLKVARPIDEAVEFLKSIAP